MDAAPFRAFPPPESVERAWHDCCLRGGGSFSPEQHLRGDVMRLNSVKGLCGKALASCRKAGGLLLVLTAVATPASAQCMVPEVDPGSLSSAVVLLVGGALILADRFRR